MNSETTNEIQTLEGQTRDLSRFAAIFASGTMASRVLGLVRDVVFAHTIPSGPLGSFLFAFSLPNMLRDMLGEGAVNAALVPVFSKTRANEDIHAYRQSVAAVMSLMLLIFLIITIVGVLVMPFTPWLLSSLRIFTGKALPQSDEELRVVVRLMQWTFPYLLFIGAAVFATAPLFVARRYSTPSWTPVLLNVTFIGCVYGLRTTFDNPAWALVIGVWLGGIAQFAVLWWDMYRHVGVILPSFRLRHSAVRQTILLLFPVIIGQAAGEVNKLVDRFFAMSLGEDKVLALYISNRLVQLPLSIFGIAVAVAILPALSHAFAKNDESKQQQIILYGLRQSFFLSAPAMAGLIALRTPIVRFLFERGEFGPTSTSQASAALLYASMGVVSFAWVKVMVQGFYARHDTRTPVLAATISMLLNVFLNMALVGPMGYLGLAFSTSISFTTNFIILFLIAYWRSNIKPDTVFFLCLGKITIATLALGISSGIVTTFVESRIGSIGIGTQGLALGSGVLAGGTLFLAICFLLRVEELAFLIKRFR